MTKEEIIKELNVCDFQDQCVLAELDTMAQGALWMQEKMLDKICEYIKNHIDPKLIIYHENTWCNVDGFIAGMRKELEKHEE